MPLYCHNTPEPQFAVRKWIPVQRHCVHIRQADVFSKDRWLLVWLCCFYVISNIVSSSLQWQCAIPGDGCICQQSFCPSDCFTLLPLSVHHPKQLIFWSMSRHLLACAIFVWMGHSPRRFEQLKFVISLN